MKEFSNRIRIIREELSITQEAAAELLKVNQSQLSRWESGERLPAFEGLLSLSMLYVVSIDYLVFGDDASPYVAIAPEPTTSRLIELSERLSIKERKILCEYLMVRLDQSVRALTIPENNN